MNHKYILLGLYIVPFLIGMVRYYKEDKTDDKLLNTIPVGMFTLPGINIWYAISFIWSKPIDHE